MNKKRYYLIKGVNELDFKMFCSDNLKTILHLFERYKEKYDYIIILTFTTEFSREEIFAYFEHRDFEFLKEAKEVGFIKDIKLEKKWYKGRKNE